MEAWSQRGVVVSKEIEEWLTNGAPGRIGNDFASRIREAMQTSPYIIISEIRTPEESQPPGSTTPAASALTSSFVRRLSRTPESRLFGATGDHSSMDTKITGAITRVE
jgi:hypothetical protein